MVKDIFFRGLRSKIAAAERSTSSAYYSSQWGEGRGRLFLIYRWVHFLLLLGALLTSLLSKDEGLPGRWPIFLTNWALVLYFSQASLALYLVSSVFLAERKGNPVKFPVLLVKMYGILHSTSIVIALGVTTIYWSFVYDPEIHQLDFVNFTVHASNSAIMLVDLCIVAHPVKLRNVYVPPLFTLIYTIFNIIYYLCGGTDRKGNHYVYRVIDWSTPISAALFILGGMFLLVILFVLIWFLAVLRRQIGIRMRAKSQDFPQQNQPPDLPLA